MEHGPRPPPPWIINWGILVSKAMIWAKQAQRFLRTPISLPMTTASTEPSTTRSQRPPCQHKYIKRSGNRHGSFARCLVEVRPRMGPTHRILSFLTIATAFLHHNCVGQLMEKPGSIEQEGTFQAFEEFWVTRFDCESGAQESSQVQGQGGNGGRRGTSLETSGTTTHCGWRGGGVDKQAGRLQLGRARELTGQLERSSQVLEAELQAYKKLPPATKVSKIDIMELYAGHADIAHQYDLKAVEPYDLIYVHNMSKDKYKRSWRQAQKWFSPLLVVVETECTILEHLQRKPELCGQRQNGWAWSPQRRTVATCQGRSAVLPSINSWWMLMATTSCLTQRILESGTFLKFNN